MHLTILLKRFFFLEALPWPEIYLRHLLRWEDHTQHQLEILKARTEYIVS